MKINSFLTVQGRNRAAADLLRDDSLPRKDDRFGGSRQSTTHITCTGSEPTAFRTFTAFKKIFPDRSHTNKKMFTKKINNNNNVDKHRDRDELRENYINNNSEGKIMIVDADWVRKISFLQCCI